MMAAQPVDSIPHSRHALGQSQVVEGGKQLDGQTVAFRTFRTINAKLVIECRATRSDT